MGQWADWVNKLNSVKFSEDVKPIEIPGVKESRKVLFEQSRMEELPEYDKSGTQALKRNQLEMNRLKKNLGYRGQQYESLMDKDSRVISDSKGDKNRYFAISNHISGITYQYPTPKTLENYLEYNDLLKAGTVSAETYVDTFINIWKGKQLISKSKKQQLDYYNALKATGNLNFSLFEGSFVRGDLIATYINLFRKGNAANSTNTFETKLHNPSLRNVKESRAMLKKTFADKGTKFIVANRAEENNPSHIVRVVYYVPKRIMEVTFAKESCLGNVCVFFEVPLKVGYEICRALDLNEKRTYVPRGKYKQETRHLAGILFWDYVRFRTTVTQTRYPFTMLGGGFTEDVSTAKTVSDLSQPDNHGIVPNNNLEDLANNDATNAEKNIILINENSVLNIDDEVIDWKNDGEWMKHQSNQYASGQYNLDSSVDELAEDSKELFGELLTAIENGDIGAMQVTYNDLHLQFLDNSKISFDKFLLKYGYKIDKVWNR